MNNHKRVLWFVIVTTSILFALSAFNSFFSIEYQPLSNISLISDVIHKNEIKKDTFIGNIDETISNTKAIKEKRFHLFQTPNRITNYSTDTNTIALPIFIKKLDELQKAKRKKIRIAFLGDSMIEDDLITQTFRTLMQQRFGGYGVGFIPVNYTLSNGRSTAIITASDNWKEVNFRNNTDKTALYISGRCFFAMNHSVTEIVDKTSIHNQILEKYFLYGNTIATNIIANEKSLVIPSSNYFNTILIDSSVSNKIKLEVKSDLPIYGVSLESPEGIIIDNFSFRGNSGIDFAKMDSLFLKNIASKQSYDLIILQYGVNIFEKATDEKFDWYLNPMKKSIHKLKASFADADLLLLSTADRSFRYGNEFKTAKGMYALLSLQQKIAYESDIAFYNTFMSMGGEGSMVNWVNSKPALAYKDYMHPNLLGSDVLGKSLYQSIIYEYQKFINTTAKQKK